MKTLEKFYVTSFFSFLHKVSSLSVSGIGHIIIGEIVIFSNGVLKQGGLLEVFCKTKCRQLYGSDFVKM